MNVTLHHHLVCWYLYPLCKIQKKLNSAYEPFLIIAYNSTLVLLVVQLCKSPKEAKCKVEIGSASAAILIPELGARHESNGLTPTVMHHQRLQQSLATVACAQRRTIVRTEGRGYCGAAHLHVHARPLTIRLARSRLTGVD